MMNATQTLKELQVVVAKFADSEVALTPATVLRADLGINSYELVQMVCAVEDSFAVDIPDRTISRLKTVQDVIDYLAAHG